MNQFRKSISLLGVLAALTLSALAAFSAQHELTATEVMKRLPGEFTTQDVSKAALREIKKSYPDLKNIPTHMSCDHEHLNVELSMKRGKHVDIKALSYCLMLLSNATLANVGEAEALNDSAPYDEDQHQASDTADNATDQFLLQTVADYLKTIDQSQYAAEIDQDYATSIESADAYAEGIRVNIFMHPANRHVENVLFYSINEMRGRGPMLQVRAVSK